MKMIRAASVLALLVLLILPAAAAEDALFQQSTGVFLPSEVAGFSKGTVIDYERSQPGAGVAIHYLSADAYTATIYVYTAGLAPFPTSLDDPAIVDERSHAVDAVLQRALEKSPLARRTGSSVWQAPTQPGPTPVDTDMFIVYPAGVATNDLLFLWLAKGRIWKLRMTRAASYRGEVRPVSFAREIVQYSVAE